MEIKINVKSALRLGALCGALGAVASAAYGAMAFARPYLLSDSPPLAGQSRVLEQSAQLAQLAQTQAQQQRSLATMYQQQLFLAQGFWTSALVAAQQQLRINPSNGAARQQALTAQQQLNLIEHQLLLAPH